MSSSLRGARPLSALALSGALLAATLSLTPPVALAAPGPTDVVRSFNASTASVGAIPDGPDTAGTCSTPTPAVREVLIPVSGVTGPISDVRIKVSIAHRKLGDVGLALVAPDGTTSVVIDRIGADRVGCGDDTPVNGTISFYDGAPGNLAAVAASVDSTRYIANGSYFPSTAGGSPIPLSAPFANAAANGTWKLRIVDYQAGNTGRVYAATLTLATIDKGATATCAQARTTLGKSKKASYRAFKKFRAASLTLQRLRDRHAPKSAIAKARKVRTKLSRATSAAKGAQGAAKAAKKAACS